MLKMSKSAAKRVWENMETQDHSTMSCCMVWNLFYLSLNLQQKSEFLSRFGLQELHELSLEVSCTWTMMKKSCTGLNDRWIGLKHSNNKHRTVMSMMTRSTFMQTHPHLKTTLGELSDVCDFIYFVD